MPAEAATILVTGASGFIGRNLAPVLAARGERVRGAARRIPLYGVAGVAEWASLDRIGPGTDWSAALRGVETVVHLAALAHQTDPRRQPSEEEFMAVNAAGTRRLAEASAACGGVRRFIFVSSIGAVAEASDGVIDEASPCRPVSPYGRSKLAGERAVREALDGRGLTWSILRPVLVYGPGNPGNMARLLRLVRSGLPLPFGGIRNRRSFVSVGNLVEAIDRLAAAPNPPSAPNASDAAGRVFHVADDEAVSTPELVRLIAAAAGRKARLWSPPRGSLSLLAKAGDWAAAMGLRTGLDGYSVRRLTDSLAVSNQALRRATGWTPRTSLAQGLAAALLPPAHSGSPMSPDDERGICRTPGAVEAVKRDPESGHE